MALSYLRRGVPLILGLGPDFVLSSQLDFPFVLSSAPSFPFLLFPPSLTLAFLPFAFSSTLALPSPPAFAPVLFAFPSFSALPRVPALPPGLPSFTPPPGLPPGAAFPPGLLFPPFAGGAAGPPSRLVDIPHAGLLLLQPTPSALHSCTRSPHEDKHTQAQAARPHAHSSAILATLLRHDPRTDSDRRGFLRTSRACLRTVDQWPTAFPACRDSPNLHKGGCTHASGRTATTPARANTHTHSRTQSRCTSSPHNYLCVHVVLLASPGRGAEGRGDRHLHTGTGCCDSHFPPH